MRGEYGLSNNLYSTPLELPPRARRIRQNHTHDRAGPGTTSACAENTNPCPRPPAPRGNYLRVRGEYFLPCCPYGTSLELPPRARRIQPASNDNTVTLGTTSACAENTEESTPTSKNYLELPPRARRIQRLLERPIRTGGTTSACAENTHPHANRKKQRWNYLRVRGEYTGQMGPGRG